MKLKPQVFERNFRKFGVPKLGLFAYRINHKIARCFSRKQDFIPIAIDAFSAKWNTEFYYIFSPCSLLWKAVAKIHGHNTKCKLDMPRWTTQHWYPNLLNKTNHNHTTITRRSNSATGSRETTSATLRDTHITTRNDPDKLHLLHQKMHIQQIVIN